LLGCHLFHAPNSLPEQASGYERAHILWD
jgi:hypothetical protein